MQMHFDEMFIKISSLISNGDCVCYVAPFIMKYSVVVIMWLSSNSLVSLHRYINVFNIDWFIDLLIDIYLWYWSLVVVDTF